MKNKDLFLIVAGLGVLYLLSKSTPAYASNPMVPGSSPGGIGGLLDSILGIFRGIPGAVTTSSNPGVDVISNPNYYNNFTGTPGAYDSGDPCDPASVQYNPSICSEM